VRGKSCARRVPSTSSGCEKRNWPKEGRRLDFSDRRIKSSSSSAPAPPQRGRRKTTLQIPSYMSSVWVREMINACTTSTSISFSLFNCPTARRFFFAVTDGNGGRFMHELLVVAMESSATARDRLARLVAASRTLAWLGLTW
jgi:hypothetical protein